MNHVLSDKMSELCQMLVFQRIEALPQTFLEKSCLGKFICLLRITEGIVHIFRFVEENHLNDLYVTAFKHLW